MTEITSPTSPKKFTADVDAEFGNLLIKFPKVWEDFVEVAWSRQLYDGRKVLKYQLTAVGKAYRVERYFSPNDVSFRLQGLNPGMDVEVQIRALVESPARGPVWCAWVSNTVTTLTPTVVSVASVSSKHIHGRIDWGSELVKNGPTPTHTAVAAAKYQVRVRQKGNILTHDVCEREFEAKVSEFIIDDQEANAVLEVQARAVSVHGDAGRWCEPTRFLTLQPVEVTASDLGETYAIIHWNRGENDNSNTAEGNVEELVIVVELLPSQRELDVDVHAQTVKVDARSFSNETRTYRIKDLLPGRTYHVRSRYRNVLGDWTEWALTPLTTLGPVRSPDVQLVGHDYIQVRWQREAQDGLGTYEEAQCDVVEWEVRCATGKASTSMRLPPSECESKLVNLLPGVDYTIDVRALTSVGEWGLWSEAVTVTTLHRLSARVDFAGETWLQVSWDRKGKRYRDNITRYHLQLNCCDTPFRVAKYFPADVTSYTFENLKPGNRFHLVIQAFSDQRWGPWSEPSEVSTCTPCTAQLIRRGEDFVQVRWNCDYYERVGVDTTDRLYQVKVLRAPLDEEDGEHSAAPTELLEEQVTTSTYRIARLPPFSRVLLNVRCFDYLRQAWCDYGPTTEYRTLPSAVVKTQVGETFVEVSWSRAPRILSAITDEEAEEGIEDPLMPEIANKFVLRLNRIDINGQHREVNKFHFDHTQATTFTITDLKPDTAYSLQLSYEDQSGRWSPDSAPIRLRTTPPLALSVLNVGEGSSLLHWARWHHGKPVPPVEDANFRLVIENISDKDVVPIQCNVSSTHKYNVTNLVPSTVYRIQVAEAPRGSSVWGVWSAPVYICTEPTMETELDVVGEDYAQVSWKRQKRRSILEVLPGSRTITVARLDAPAGPPLIDNENGEGHMVHVGEETVLEYQFQLFRLSKPTEEDPDAPVARELAFEAKLHSQQHSVRVPGLVANVPYEAFVCASPAKKEWGVWSNALGFETSMPTEVRVASITQESIRVEWGKGDSDIDAFYSDIMKHHLVIDGVDDEYHVEAELDPEVRNYTIKGLSINANYAVKVRSFLRSESEWGAWCHPIYIRLQVISVDLVEASQNWVHLKWPNKATPDNRAKVQFLSLLGEGVATTVTLDGTAKNHVFRDLKPSTLYTAHLLLVEQSPTYIKPAPSGSTQVNTGRAVEASGTVASFSIPVVSADFSAYLADGFVFRTQRALELRVDRAGQNFLLLKWQAIGDNPEGGAATSTFTLNDNFEVEITETDGDRANEPKLHRAQGDRILVKHLKPSSTVKCSVRWVAARSDVASQWSKPVVAKLLPMIEPIIGAGDAAEAPGIGEDYLTIHWNRSLRLSNFEGFDGLGFEVRLTALGGPELGNPPRIAETTEARHHFTGLEPDTEYKIEVRTVITHEEVMGGDGVSRGEWSRPLECTTLSPMAVAVTDVVEVGAVVHWRRRNAAVGDNWWEGLTEEERLQEVAAISSFHVKVSAADNASQVVYDEQFSEHHGEYAACAAKLKALRPGGRYSVSVRASTGMLWGRWSDPIEFNTQRPVALTLPMVGDHFIVAHWEREGTQPLPQRRASDVSEASLARSSAEAAAIALNGAVLRWELSFSTVGRTKANRIVEVDRSTMHTCVGDLESNEPYTVCVRPVYPGDETGPWSIPAYFVTLAAFQVDVAKVGETFAQVSWKRAAQEALTRRMRYRLEDATRDVEEEISTIHLQLQQLLAEAEAAGDDMDTLQEGASVTTPQLHELQKPGQDATQPASADDTAPTTLDEMLGGEGEKGQQPKEEADAASDESSTGSRSKSNSQDRSSIDKDAHNATTAPHHGDEHDITPRSATVMRRHHIADLRATLRDRTETRDKRHKLTTLQLADIERQAKYPDGEDVRFELVVYGGAEEGDTQPLLYRKRLGKGEYLNRLEGLDPKTIYEVCVRSVSTNHTSMDGVTVEPSIGDVDENTRVPWGGWSERERFVTLKPITATAKSVGSECIAVEWDTGNLATVQTNLAATGTNFEASESADASSRTAISKFQVQVIEPRKTGAQARRELTLEDPTLTGYVVGGLQPDTIYSVSVRVCYEGDKWGVFSAPIHFITMPKLLCKLQSVAERQIELLVWRDSQSAVPEGQGIIVWKPLVSEHQLAINDVPCAQPFSLESSTSTLVTLDTLAIDTEYHVSVKDRVESYWQDFREILVCETIPYAPERPTLQERKGTSIALGWEHRQSLDARQYVYMVEIAIREEESKAKKRITSPVRRSRNATGSMDNSPSRRNFQLLGYTVAQEFRLELNIPIHLCAFRVSVCKTNQTIDGEPHPITVPPNEPQAAMIDNPSHYVWSLLSPVAKFKTPSVPDHPTGLHVVNLTHNAALLRWKRPANFVEHGEILYRVYLNNSYADRFTCVCQTMDTQVQLRDLVTNCHYRVSVTAESSMGTSQHNNTLHFSTKVTPKQGLEMLRGRFEKPLTSTLPPRAALRAPSFILNQARSPTSMEEITGALLEDGGTSILSGGPNGQTPQPAGVTMTTQKMPRPSSALSGRPRTLPPLDNPSPAASPAAADRSDEL